MRDGGFLELVRFGTRRTRDLPRLKCDYLPENNFMAQHEWGRAMRTRRYLVERPEKR